MASLCDRRRGVLPGLVRPARTAAGPRTAIVLSLPFLVCVCFRCLPLPFLVFPLPFAAFLCVCFRCLPPPFLVFFAAVPECMRQQLLVKTGLSTVDLLGGLAALLAR